MSGFELNKVIASILLASLIAMVVGTVVNVLYKPDLSPKDRGYSVSVIGHGAGNGPGQNQADAQVLNIADLMKKANASNGQNLIKKCVACHSLEKNGINKIGPHLWNVIGRKRAGISDYKYSAAMIAAGGVWDYESLFGMIKKPSVFMPGTKMSFAGMSTPQDVADIIEYLRVNAHDAPIPQLP